MNEQITPLSAINHEKIQQLNVPHLERVLNEFITICKPSKVTVITDTQKDIKHVREMAIHNREETKLAKEGHTVHFDGYFDQARDKENTRVLISKDSPALGPHINQIDREKGLAEIFKLLDNVMKGKECFIRFFCLGPHGSPLMIPAVQITDSAYVAHSEDLLYRPGHEEFKRLQPTDFFFFIHSAGELTEKGVSKNVTDRRIFIDLQENRVFSVNNQYAGNSVGLKKLALRLAINKAVETDKDWLAEHMFIGGVVPLDGKRKTYFLGAFPSACGKTSTAMIPGNTIVGDDIAYIRLIDGEPRAVNIESGIFGIIKDVCLIDDPLIYKALTTPRETIFSNVQITAGEPYWQGMGVEPPKRGINWSSSLFGEWYEGKQDNKGRIIPNSHGNARYTIRLSELENVDDKLHDAKGVRFHGILYGGRDSDTSVPIVQSLDWNHGVFIGASLESETTSATLGQEGVRKLNPFANLDFMVVPLGNYIKAHLEFGKQCGPKVPLIFGTNYFLKNENGKYFDDIIDKKIWLLWAEGRVHGNYSAIKTPIGYIPKFEDLETLFWEALEKKYTQERYELEFAIRIQYYLEKIDRIEESFENEENMPQEFYDEIQSARKRLMEAKKSFGFEVILPSAF